MDTRSFPNLTRIAVLLSLTLISTACSPRITPTFFVAPTQPAPAPALTRAAPASAPTIIPVVATITPSSGPCTDGLTYIQDLTIPDNTLVAPGQSIDKQWLVTNSGTCNWDSKYRLKLVDGTNLGAGAEEALYPARTSTQATLHITFTAPPSAGFYRSGWQAFNPAGEPFGDQIFLVINVSP